jgi:hypothetical protein
MERPFFRGAVAHCSLPKASIGTLGGDRGRIKESVVVLQV